MCFFYYFLLLLFFIFIFSGRFGTSGSMIARSVPEIEGGSPEKKKKDWSWSILVVGYDAR